MYVRALRLSADFGLFKSILFWIFLQGTFYGRNLHNPSVHKA